MLAAAITEFSQRPYDEVTVAGIARTAGVAHGLVSHHFNGKQGAYTAAVDAVYEQLRAAEDTETAGTPREQLRARFRTFLTFVAANPDAALNLILAPTRDAAFVDRRAHGLEVIATLLDLTPTPPLTAALQAFADAAEGLTTTWLRQNQPYPLPAMVAAFTTLLAGALHTAQALDPTLNLTPAHTHL
nr:TetR family transcriptional regulator [Kribbella sandramycini]